MNLESTIRCPHCGEESPEQMPVMACVILHECRACGRDVRPKEGDCCVFCSYGTEPCPTAAGGAPKRTST